MVELGRSVTSVAVLVALAAVGPACGDSKNNGTDGGPQGGGGTGQGGDRAGGGAGATGSGGMTASCAAGGAGGEAGAGGGTAGSGAGGSGTNCAGNAMSFAANGTGTDSDAAHARVLVDLKDDLPSDNAKRTVEFWAYVRPTDWVGDTNTLFEYGSQAATAGTFGLDFGGAAGSINPYTDGGFDNDNQPTCLDPTVSQWVHFAMTWDGFALRAYVNGVLRSTKTNAKPSMLATSKGYLTIGCNSPRFSCFAGHIDEFRVWKVARTAAEIATTLNRSLAGNETGLVGYWKFNEPPGATAAADSVTTAGHVPHPGMPMAVTAEQTPTFVSAVPPAPIACP